MQLLERVTQLLNEFAIVVRGEEPLVSRDRAVTECSMGRPGALAGPGISTLSAVRLQCISYFYHLYQTVNVHLRSQVTGQYQVFAAAKEEIE